MALEELQQRTIPWVTSKLKEIEDEFAAYQAQRLSQGYAKPTELSKKEYERVMSLEAQYDVFLEEAEDLQRKLKEYVKSAEKEAETRILEYGLLCVGRFHGTHATDPSLMDQLKTIDGQNVGLSEEGLLIITDERSPYRGMLVADYRELAKVWWKQRQREQAEKFKLLQQSYAEQGLSAPSASPATAPRKIAKGSLPAWPEGVRNYLSNETITK